MEVADDPGLLHGRAARVNVHFFTAAESSGEVMPTPFLQLYGEL